MLHFTQLIFIKPGCEEVFLEFEDRVLPLLSRYGGRLIYRVRPATNSVLHSEVGEPYEVHLITFPTEQDFQAYVNDSERQQHLGLKNTAVEKVLLIQGREV